MVLSVAPGKVLFAGEFAGLFDLPIVTCSINLYTKVAVEHIPGKLISLSTSYHDLSAKNSAQSITRDWKLAWDAFINYEKSGDFSLLKEFRSGIHPLKLAVGAVLSESGQDVGMKLSVTTDLPIGCGLGSSASMCVAVVGGVSSLLGMNWTAEKVNEIAYKIEQILNGKPSGGDNTAVTYGGWQIFCRDEVEELLIEEKKYNWWLVDGGEPAESSLDMFKIVTNHLDQDIETKNEIRERYSAHVKKVISQTKNGIILSKSIKEEQQINELLGIVGNQGRKIVSTIEEVGGYARICGAGGVVGGVGTILCYHEDEEKLKYVANKENFSYSPVILGGLGWHIKK